MEEIEKLRRVKESEAEIWKNSENMEYRSLEIVDLLKGILSENPENMVALTNLGAMYSNMGKYKEALDILKRVEVMNFDDRNLYYNIGVVLANLSQEKEARKYFEVSTTKEPDELTFEAYFDFHAG